jgi:predicted MFS family arabinose efflux permease
LSAGITTIGSAIGAIISSQTIGRVYPRVGPKRMVVIGEFGLCLMIAAFFLIGSGANLWYVRVILFGAGYCFNATMLASQIAMFSTISSVETASGSSIFAAGRQAGNAVGVALLTTVLSSVHSNQLTAFHVAFLVDSGLALLTAFAALALIHDSDAAATMQPR